MRDDYLTLEDLEQWVNNDEGLYQWWRAEGGSLRSFVRAHRDQLRTSIRRFLSTPPERTHYGYGC